MTNKYTAFFLDLIITDFLSSTIVFCLLFQGVLPPLPLCGPTGKKKLIFVCFYPNGLRKFILCYFEASKNEKS